MKWPILAVLMLALAGCADGGPTSDPCTDDPTSPGCGPAIDEDDIDDDLGLIRGVVVDATITPIVGATVKLLSTEQTTETDETGGFVFLDLDRATTS